MTGRMSAPKLTLPEMGRLEQIHRQNSRGDLWKASCGRSPFLTAKLIEKGLVESRGGSIAKTGRVMQHAEAHLTETGRAVLAGFPQAGERS